MGLDLVEIFIEIEESLGTSIPDRDAENIHTVGELIRYVWSNVQARAGTVCVTSRTFYTLRRELMTLLPLGRHDIRPASSVEALVPKNRRRKLWKRLRVAGLEPPNLGVSALAVSVAGAVEAALAIVLALWSVQWFMLYMVLALLVGWWATRPLAACVPAGSGTVRNLVLHMAVPRSHAIAGATWTREEVAHKIRCILADCLGVPLEKVRDDSRFVEDLGAG